MIDPLTTSSSLSSSPISMMSSSSSASPPEQQYPTIISHLIETLATTNRESHLLIEGGSEAAIIKQPIINENLTCPNPYQRYSASSVIILGFTSLPVAMFGLMANMISIRIFTHKLMRSSPINWYLAVLSSSDFFVILSSFFMHCLPRLSEYMGVFGGYRASLYLSPLIYPIGTMAQTISVYATILMSAHRFIGVCFPFQAGGILRKRRVKIAIFSLVSLAILFNFTRLFEVRTRGECYAREIADWSVILTVTRLRENGVYKWVFMGLGQTIIMFIVPFLSLIFLNSRIAYAVHRTRIQHKGVHSGDVGSGDASKRAELTKEISTSVMLVGIVVVFLACNSLSFMVNIIECADLVVTIGVGNFIRLVEVSNLLVNINASINIAIYCLFSEKYRQLLAFYVACGWRKEGEFLLSNYD